jgi:hypothetical protein
MDSSKSKYVLRHGKTVARVAYDTRKRGIHYPVNRGQTALDQPPGTPSEPPNGAGPSGD